MFTSQCVSQIISIYAKSVEHPGVNGLRMLKFDSEDAVITLIKIVRVTLFATKDNNEAIK